MKRQILNEAASLTERAQKIQVNKDAEALIKQAEGLSEQLRKLEAKNPAAFKARRKVESAIDILEMEWPTEKTTSTTEPK